MKGQHALYVYRSTVGVNYILAVGPSGTGKVLQSLMHVFVLCNLKFIIRPTLS